MGVSTHIVGFVEPTETWRKFKQVWDACNAAGIEVPKEVLAHFHGDYPDEAGRMFNLEKASYVRPFKADMEEGFEICVAEIPEGMTTIRFYNSW